MSTDQKTSNEQSSWQNIAYSNMIGNEALLRILVRREIISQEEFAAEVKKVHEEFLENQTQESGS